MKAKEMRSMGKEELQTKLEELKKELMKANAQISTGTTPKSPGQVKQIKKNIARILTIVHEKNSSPDDLKDQNKEKTQTNKKPKEVDKKHE